LTFSCCTHLKRTGVRRTGRQPLSEPVVGKASLGKEEGPHRMIGRAYGGSLKEEGATFRVRLPAKGPSVHFLLHEQARVLLGELGHVLGSDEEVPLLEGLVNIRRGLLVIVDSFRVVGHGGYDVLAEEEFFEFED